MLIGTNLLVQIFEEFDTNNTKPKVFRRLYCESGQSARKSYRFVNDSTRKRLEKIVPESQNCKHEKLQTSTIVIVLEELTRIKSHAIIKELYSTIGGPAKRAASLSRYKTQRVIQKLELHQ